MGRKRTNSRRSAINWSYFPLELWAEVLARLPAKTLLKFRCVSKEWKSLIESPKFASLHLNIYKNNREITHLLVTAANHHERFHLFASAHRADTFRMTYQIDFPDCSNRTVYIQDSAAGLVLWRICDPTRITLSRFMVWNPSIRKSIEIPGLSPSPCTVVNLAGLGYDAVADDCKVVFVSIDASCLTTRFLFFRPHPGQSPVPILLHVYSIRGRTWRTSNVDAQVLKCRNYSRPSTFLNGAMHWIGYDVSIAPYPVCGSHILAFDLNSEAFSSFRLPHGWQTSADFSVLAVLDGLLALLGNNGGFVTIHVMEQSGLVESWVKRYSFRLPYGRLLYFKRNGELLLSMSKPGLKAYDIESQKMKDLTKTYRPKSTVFFVDAFVESLVLLT